MDGFISIIVIIIAVMAITRRVKAGNTAVNRRANSGNVYRSNAKPKSYAKEYSSEGIYEGKMKDGVKHSAKGGTTITDDRRNDWLAKQMREEKAALYRMGNMFGIKTGQGTINAATQNKNLHERSCQADGVDTASGR